MQVHVVFKHFSRTKTCECKLANFTDHSFCMSDNLKKLLSHFLGKLLALKFSKTF